MKIQIKMLLVLIGVFFMACSKDDAGSTPADQDGGIVYRSQLVMVNMGSVILSQETYHGTIDGIAVEMSKTEDNKLAFLVPYEAALGEHDLKIVELDHTIRYDVKNTVLSSNAAEVMSGLTANMATFESTLDDSPEADAVRSSIDSFNAVFENATDAEKVRMATLYQANKATFDNIILYEGSSGRSIEPSDISLLADHSYAVYVMAAGAIVALVAPEPVEKALGVGLIAIGAYKARSYFLQLLTKKLNTITLTADNIMGTNNRNVNSGMAFTDNVSRTVALNAITKSLTTADAAKTQPAVVSFFEDYNEYNYWVNLTNEAIVWVNDNVIFADFDLIPLEQLPANAAQTPEAVDANAFSNMTFSINHSNLQLETASLSATGQLTIKIKIVGTPASTPVVSTLNYTYDDEFSSFSGSFPISVTADTADFLVGSWTMTEFNGVPTEVYQVISECPSNPTATDTYSGYTMFGTATFTSTSFSAPAGRTQVYNYCQTGQCANGSLCYTNPNAYAHSGTYQSDGNYQFTVLTNNGGAVNTTITVVDQTHITVVQGGNIKKYVRS